MIILPLTFFLGFACGLPLIILLVIGYREQVRQITATANRNAGYWAEAEQRANEAETTIQQGLILIEQYDHVLALHQKRGDEFQRIAHEALKIAHHKEFTPKSERDLREMPWDEMRLYLREAQDRGAPFSPTADDFRSVKLLLSNDTLIDGEEF